MKKLLIITFLALVSISLSATSSFAQTIQDETIPIDPRQTIVKLPAKSNLSCKQSIDNVKKDLVKRGFFRGTVGYAPRGESPKVSISKDFIQKAYKEYPPNRTETIYFDTFFAKDLHNSPKLMATLASQIISQCNQVGIVTFISWEEMFPVGYFLDNTVRTFVDQSRGLPLGERPEGYVDFKWGYAYWVQGATYNTLSRQ
jgi:hypothetical protein